MRSKSGAPYTYEQVWGEHTYRVESDGETARAFADGQEICCGRCGVRLVTNREGKLLYTLDIE